MPYTRIRPIGLRPLLSIPIPLLWGGMLLHARVLGTISIVAGQCGATGYIEEPTAMICLTTNASRN